jgi:hypothetical protein
LQTKADFNSYEEEGEEQKVSDQQLSLYFHLTEEEHSTFNIDIEGNKQQVFSFQLEKQHKEVFLCGFDDPIADYLQSMSNICVKVFLLLAIKNALVFLSVFSISSFLNF